MNKQHNIPNLAQDGDFKSGFMSGVVSSAYASALGTDQFSNLTDKIDTVGTSALVGGLISTTFGGDFWDGARQGATSAALNELGNHLQDNHKAKKAQNGGNYISGEGNISPSQFRDIYEGKTEGQIMIGESTFLGYKYPNNMADKSTRFVMLSNGKEVDMIHFMVVGRAGHILGIGNEFQQFVRGKASGFNPQDLYSNKLGVNFFNNYHLKIDQSPSQISNYIFQYLTNPNVLYPPSFQPQYEFGPKW